MIETILNDATFQYGVALVVCVFGLFFVTYVGERVAADARLSKYAKGWEILRAKAADWIVYIRYGDVDLRDVGGVDFYDKAEELTILFGRTIDPRMAFLLDKVEAETKRLGLKIDLEELLAAAERKYTELRFGNNGLTLNDKDAPAIVTAQELPVTLEKRPRTRLPSDIPNSLK